MFCTFHLLPLHQHLFLHNINTDCPKHDGSWLGRMQKRKYRISQPIRRTFFPEKCDLNFTLCAEGKYYFQTYKYLYPHRVKTTMRMILVAVTVFWVSLLLLLAFSPWASLGRNQSPVRQQVWLWYAASWASS